MLKENLQDVLERIDRASARSISGEKVQLIAVTKTHGLDLINEAISYGVTDIGENKVQELERKKDGLISKVNLHMIGNLQSNKVKYIYKDICLIHSLDRKSLAKEIQKRASQDNIKVHCLVQVNIGREETKGGLAYEKVLPFIESMMDYDHIKIDGLMAMAPHIDDEKALRAYFRKMFDLKELVAKEKFDGVDMTYLSMGMSNDYELAIEEGSNMVRIGSDIFGKRDYSK
ncbi:MAG: YggS family pyridoxal phosphate-dependent enzyme [Tissierellia bacterium]|nr:YggS family pyridoxal phosphate-dependent enzyme [Tissierellia bacterium]